MEYDMSSFCKPFLVITDISCHPVNDYYIKVPPVALFPLDRGEKWPTSTLTKLVQSFPLRPDQSRPIEATLQGGIWGGPCVPESWQIVQDEKECRPVNT